MAKSDSNNCIFIKQIVKHFYKNSNIIECVFLVNG